MADTIDLGSIFERSAGSSPVRRTKAKKPPAGFFVLVRMIGLSLCTPGRMQAKRSILLRNNAPRALFCADVQVLLGAPTENPPLRGIFCWSIRISEPNSGKNAKRSSQKLNAKHFVLCRCSSPVTLQVRCHRRTRICITQRPRQPATVVGGDFFVSENHDKSKKCARKCANPIVNIAFLCYTGEREFRHKGDAIWKLKIT